MLFRKTSLATLFYYLGIIIANLNAFWLCPKYLTSTQIGLYAGVHNMALLLAPFAQLGLSQSTIRYFPQFRKDKPLFLGLLVSTGIIGFATFAAICKLFQAPLVGYFAKKSPELSEHFLLVIFVTFLLTAHRLGKDWARSLHNIFLPSFVQNVLTKGLIPVSVLLYAKQCFGYATLLKGLPAIYVVGLMSYVAYMGYRRDLRVSFAFSRLPNGFIAEFVRYTLLNTVGSSAFVLVTKLDSLMIMALIGLSAGGVYVTAICLAALIEAPRRALKQIAQPVLAQLLMAKDKQAIERLNQQIALHQLLVATGLFMLVYINLRDIFALLPGVNYQAGQQVALLICLAKVMDTPFGVNGDLVQLSRYYWFNALSLLLLLGLSVATNYWLIPCLGICGAAAATVLSLFVYNSITSFFVWYKLDIQPFTWRMLYPPCLLAVLLGAYHCLPALKGLTPWQAIGLRSIMASTVYISTVIMLRISPTLNDILSQRLRHR